MDEDTKPIRRARTRYKTIVCSFCLVPVDDACFAWSSGLCICQVCLKYATEEVEKAAQAKKMTELGSDLIEVATKLKVRQPKMAPNPNVTAAQTIAEIKLILSSHEPTPDDVA